ncbi:hypothetical protein [Spirosoma flavum]|uniref:Uncharacterized protein n=1 Tax=Spirosoma flavum TaxID=2048557 RepID=A0ABW6AQJ7_9BACT
MSKALKPPTYNTNIEPIGVDLVITTIQYALVGLTWLNQSLGRVYPKIVDGKTEPWIYKDDAEYYRAYPNDTLESFSCIYAHDDEQPDKEIYQTRSVSIIIWVNLQKLGIQTPSTEMLKREVWRVLRDLDCVLSFTVTKDQTTSGTTAIYPGFDVSGLEDRYNTYPYGAFRVECVTKFADLCY